MHVYRNAATCDARDYIISCHLPQITANDRQPPHLITLGWPRISLLAVSKKPCIIIIGS